MADTNFSAGTTISSAWLNDVNDNIYDGNVAPVGTLRNTLADAATVTKGGGVVGYGGTLNYAANTLGWAARTTSGGENVLRWITPSLWSAILDHTSVADLSVFLQAAITASEHLYFPAGRYNHSLQLNINKSIQIDGVGHSVANSSGVSVSVSLFGSQLHYTGTGTGIYLGATTYLTDVSLGYYRVGLRGLEIYGDSTTATCLLKNDGIRTLSLENMYLHGGTILFQSRACFAGLYVARSRFILAADACVKMFSRNNNATFLNCQFLAGTNSGITFETDDTFETQDIVLESCDFEGNGVGLRIAGNCENLAMLGCHFENNVQFSTLIDNSNGTKTNIVYDTCMFLSTSNGGQAATIGNSGVNPLMGVVVQNCKFIRTPLNWYAVTDVLDRCRSDTNVFSGTGAVESLPPINWGPDPNAGFIPFSRVMPHYPKIQAVPFGSADTKGTIGEIRHDNSYAYVKCVDGQWRRAALSTW